VHANFLAVQGHELKGGGQLRRLHRWAVGSSLRTQRRSRDDDEQQLEEQEGNKKNEEEDKSLEILA
jgi:hypothetical protein